MSDAAAGQQVPGRDLLDFPIGTVAEAPAIARQAEGGLWNPAAPMLREGTRVRVTAAALTTPRDQGVSAQLIGGAVAIPGKLTASLAVVRAAVADIVRTGSDPQSIGDDVPYNTTLFSLGLSRRTRDFLSAGVALRYRTGQLDARRQGAFGLDGGVLADGLLGHDARVGISTFLWRPGWSAAAERTRFSAAGDVRVVGSSERREIRTGYSVGYSPGSDHEHYLFGSGRSGPLEARTGIARGVRFGERMWRLRLGVGLYHAGYTLGVARDEAGADLAPTYQFTLSSAFK